MRQSENLIFFVLNIYIPEKKSYIKDRFNVRNKLILKISILYLMITRFSKLVFK